MNSGRHACSNGVDGARWCLRRNLANELRAEAVRRERHVPKCAVCNASRLIHLQHGSDTSRWVHAVDDRLPWAWYPYCFKVAMRAATFVPTFNSFAIEVFALVSLIEVSASIMLGRRTPRSSSSFSVSSERVAVARPVVDDEMAGIAGMKWAPVSAEMECDRKRSSPGAVSPDGQQLFPSLTALVDRLTATCD